MLPADWKEAIMRAIRSNITPVPNNLDENPSNLPPLELALQETTADDHDESPTFTITGTWVQVKNMPTVRASYSVLIFLRTHYRN